MKPLVSETFPLSGQRLIEASAGTGKTYTITSLYLRLLLGRDDSDNTRPLATGEILVLTFTIAATDELRQRIRDRVANARNCFFGEDPDDEFVRYLLDSSADIARDRKLLSAALQTMDEAAIYTIHGFCARVLNEQSFETGTLFNQSLDADRDVLLQHAAEDCFRAHILTLTEFKRGLALALWPNPDRLLQQIKPFLFRHNLKLQPGPMDVEEELVRLSHDVRACKNIWLDENISKLINDSRFHGGRKVNKHLPLIEEYCASDRLDLDIWEPWTKDLLERATTSKTIQPVHRIFELIDSIWERRFIHAQVESNLWHEVMDTVRGNLTRYKNQMGQLTLDDLLTNVHAALHHQGDNTLAEHLRAKYPVALIDEFQDTDDIQFEIFNKIYFDRNEHNLFLIGDPKQAIYQFRGADIYTYINAKRQISEEVYSLATNWRSTEPLVAAVNFLFHKPDIFGDDRDIPFQPVQAKPRTQQDEKLLVVNGVTRPPVSIGTFDGSLRMDQLRRLAMNHAAEETAQLLNQAADGTALIADKPVSAGQIAFLVRGWQDARAARQALSNRNIRSVYVTLESVLLSDTAEDLKLILQAVLEPTNERALKAALATRLMQGSASEIDALSHDVLAQQSVIFEFQEYHHLWATIEVAPMIERLIVKRRIAEKWFRQQDGERQITNLRHLSEILQQRSTVAPGMFRLIKWFSREKQAAETVAVEERQLRLESDKDLVQIITMHASKGLEYDIVMIPMAGFVAIKPGKTDPVLLHQQVSSNQGQQTFETILELTSDQSIKDAAYTENLAEDMRLLYVAITRARYHCYLGLPIAKSTGKTALGRLFSGASGTASLSDPAGPEEMLAQLASLPSTLFEVTDVTQVGQTLFDDFYSTSNLSPPPVKPKITDRWRVHSYTGLSRLIQSDTFEPPNAVIEPGFSDDDAGATVDDQNRAKRERKLSRFTFPRGPRIGVALHDMLETLDFDASASGIEIAVQRLIDRVVAEDKEDWFDPTTQWVEDILSTPMKQALPFALKDIPASRRLNELEFHFPVSMTNDFLNTLQDAGYLETNATLSVKPLNGMMTGFIDLVVLHDEKYYLIDYKSNDLGPDQLDYADSNLSQAIKHHQYDLQYLIYCVALNRYLKRCLPQYNYASDFGGVCYLFLRGMSGKAGDGIFFDLPDEKLIDRLDQCLSPGVTV